MKIRLDRIIKYKPRKRTIKTEETDTQKDICYRTLKEQIQFVNSRQDVLGVKTRRVGETKDTDFHILNHKLLKMSRIKIKVHNRCILSQEEITEIKQEIRVLKQSRGQYPQTHGTSDYQYYKQKIREWFNDNPRQAIDPITLAKKLHFLIHDQEDKDEWYNIINRMQLAQKEHDGLTYVYPKEEMGCY